MPAKKYIVKLENKERAQILLKADEGWKDKEIIEALNTSTSAMGRTICSCALNRWRVIAMSR